MYVSQPQGEADILSHVSTMRAPEWDPEDSEPLESE